MLRIDGGRHTFDDADLVAFLDLLGQVVADQLGALAVIRANERHGDAFFLERGVIQLVVDIHHDDAGVDGFLDDRYQRFRIGGSDHQAVDLGNDHLFDDLDLVRGVLFVLDAIGNQVILGGVGFLMFLGAVFHGQEKFIGQRFHHQRNLRFGSGLRHGRQRRQGTDQNGGSNQLEADTGIHRKSPESFY